MGVAGMDSGMLDVLLAVQQMVIGNEGTISLKLSESSHGLFVIVIRFVHMFPHMSGCENSCSLWRRIVS